MQSTNHIFMVEPVDFHSNPQTKETNAYQHDDDQTIKGIQSKAVAEFRAFRDLLVTHGVCVSTALGQEGAPDDIFCNNWISTHIGRRAVLYPMLAENRKVERRDDLLALVRRSYSDIFDFSAHEQKGKALESTGALCLDRVNKIAYFNASPRADESIARLWADTMDYVLVPFETEYEGQPVYHTDVVMWIGTKMAGVCSECIKDKEVVLEQLSKTHEVLEFTNDQMKSFCGNALEVVGKGGEKMLVMSAAGFNELKPSQRKVIGKHYRSVIQPNIKTIEYYGGGSARCMLLEMF